MLVEFGPLPSIVLVDAAVANAERLAPVGVETISTTSDDKPETRSDLVDVPPLFKGPVQSVAQTVRVFRALVGHSPRHRPRRACGSAIDVPPKAATSAAPACVGTSLPVMSERSRCGRRSAVIRDEGQRRHPDCVARHRRWGGAAPILDIERALWASRRSQAEGWESLCRALRRR